jgi:hypothetical protein
MPSYTESGIPQLCVNLSYLLCESRRSCKRVSLALDNVPHNASFLLFFRLATDIVEDLVHFFQSLACGLRDDKVREYEGEETKYGEEGVGTVSGVLDEGWSDETLHSISSIRRNQQVR